MVPVPAHNLLAPVRACVMAAARVMPFVCGVFGSSWCSESLALVLLTFALGIHQLLKRLGPCILILDLRHLRQAQRRARSRAGRSLVRPGSASPDSSHGRHSNTAPKTMWRAPLRAHARRLAGAPTLLE